MYRCIACGNKTERLVSFYDEYDEKSYPACGECGGAVTEKSAECACCNDDIFEGEKIYKVGQDYFCKKCVREIVA